MFYHTALCWTGATVATLPVVVVSVKMVVVVAGAGDSVVLLDSRLDSVDTVEVDTAQGGNLLSV